MSERSSMLSDKATTPTGGVFDISARALRRVNWTLVVGLAIVVFVALLALAGPDMAPKDPIQEVMIIQVEGEWMIPPYRMFTPGYPLGSDEFGRDLYSRLLWGIRPTLIMVAIVALVRLVAGVILGMLAGWWNNRMGRLLDTLIEGALAVPVLLVALAAIAVVGAEMGIWAFILGLALTGWVETAQQVRAQTRMIKQQAYVEAARALGLSNRQILLSHILHQISPMILMLFAFEVSSTMMTTAGLGFLGYYIGGDVWVDVSDFVARRISGTPELGQMLATSWSTLTQPWGMVAAGSMVFITVLGFNLVGEGIRHNLDLARVNRNSPWVRLQHAVTFWLDEHLLHPASRLLAVPGVKVALIGALAVLALWAGSRQFLPGLLARWEASQPVATTESASQPASAPGASPSPGATETVVTVTYEPRIAWQIDFAGRLVGGPLLDPSETRFYLLGLDGSLAAYDLQSEQIWVVAAVERGYGSPAVGADGTIYVTDARAGLHAFGPDGALQWTYQSQAAPNSLHAPVVGADGRIFFAVTNFSNGFVEAISAAGELLWSTQLRTQNVSLPLITSPDGQYVFLRDDILRADTGEHLSPVTDLNILRYQGSSDGGLYALAANTVLDVSIDSGALQVQHTFRWETSHNVGSTLTPSQFGVIDGQQVWVSHTTPGGSTLVAWVDREGGPLGAASYNMASGNILHVDDDLSLFACGGRAFDDRPLTCVLFRLLESNPAWQIDLDNHGPVVGAVKIGDQYLVAGALGRVFMIAPHAQISAPEPVPASAAGGESGIVWRTALPGDIQYGPVVSSSGTSYLVTQANHLLTIDPEGRLASDVQLPASLYLARDVDGSLTGGVAQPAILSGDICLVMTSENQIVAYDRSGEQRWAYEFEVLPYLRPLLVGDAYFVLDAQAQLYKFTSEGLAWVFTPTVANRLANGLLIAPDGTLYYTITNLGNGFIQAVSVDGEGLWTEVIATSFFYHDPQLSLDGRYLFLHRDIYDLQAQERLVIDIPFTITRFQPGYDGQNYMVSDRTILQFQIRDNNFEVLNSARVGDYLPGRLLTYKFFDIAADGVIWLYIFGGGPGGQVIFLTPDGEELRIHPTDPGYRFGRRTFNPSELTECTYEVEAMALSCKVYGVASEQPLRIAVVTGVPEFTFNSPVHFSDDGFVYLLSEAGELIKLFMDLE
jgi:peptide/nickel transport system permease protein